MSKQIFTDGHLDGLNGIGGIFPNSGYSKLKIGREFIEIPYQKKKLTNNEAELIAIFHACVKADEGDTILSDSEIALNLSKKGRSEEPRLDLIALVNNYFIIKKKLNLQWIRREDNPIT